MPTSIPGRQASIACLPQEVIDAITDIACEDDLTFTQKEFNSIFVAAADHNDKHTPACIASFLEENPQLPFPKSLKFELGHLDLTPIAHVLPRLIHISHWHFHFTTSEPPPCLLMLLSHICKLVTEVEFEADLHINMLAVILPVLPSLRLLELQGHECSFNLAATHSNFTFPPTFHHLHSWVILPCTSMGIKMGTLWSTVTTLSSVHAFAVTDDTVQKSSSGWARPFNLHRCTNLRYFKIEAYAKGTLEACVATIITLNSTVHLELHVSSDFLLQEPYYQKLLPRLNLEISHLHSGGTQLSLDLALIQIELQHAYIDELHAYALQYLMHLLCI
ncbi:hypothetical protein F5146DRAFT_1145706 [Armillaria mellea]|nr:hypothetical protein F5146DRAFT_1145706 [Armillaria mellea]